MRRAARALPPVLALLATLLALPAAAAGQSPADVWHLASIRVPQQVDCAPQPQHVEHVWIRHRSNEAVREWQELEQRLKQQYGTGYVLRRVGMRRHRPMAVARVDYPFRCRDSRGNWIVSYRNYTHEIATDDAGLDATLAKIRAKDPRVRFTRIDAAREIDRRAAEIDRRNRVNPARPPERERSMGGELIDASKEKLRDVLTDNDPWRFHVFRYAARTPGCAAITFPRAGSGWLRTGADYEANRKRMVAEALASNVQKDGSQGYVDHWSVTVRPGKPIYLAKVRWTYRCDGGANGVEYEWKVADKPEQITAPLERRRSSWPGASYRMEWIDLQAEVGKLSPRARVVAVGVRG